MKRVLRFLNVNPHGIVWVVISTQLSRFEQTSKQVLHDSCFSTIGETNAGVEIFLNL